MQETVSLQIAKEKDVAIGAENIKKFKKSTVLLKLKLHRLLCDIKVKGESICAIGAPSRGSTLVNFVGLDDGLIDYVCEIRGSHKIEKYLPGTLISVVEEQVMFDNKPDYALFLSWHIADELMPKLKKKGFEGKFIIPLPEPKILQ